MCLNGRFSKIWSHLKKLYNRHLSDVSHDITNCTRTDCIICARSFVANLSGKELSDPQILLLSKGLSFIPTARDSSHFELLRDFDCFCNRIRTFARTGGKKSNIKKIPFKRISKYQSKQPLLSTAKFEGALEAMKVEISNIPTTVNIPHNLS